MNLSDEISAIRREIRDLKTAQKLPSTITPYTATFTLPQVGENDQRYTYRIYYAPEDNAQEPITIFNYAMKGVYLKPYDFSAQTQDIRIDYTGTLGSTVTVSLASNRQIISVQPSTDPAPPSPVIPVPPEPPIPIEEWTQVRNFELSRMGTAPGWCLRNCCWGFGIYGGGFPNARADMNSQMTNGTLHTDLPPPSYIAVPVYCESGTPNGHVVVWDHGKVYSDGVLIPEGLSHWRTVYGWGELCGGYRVVQHT